MDNKSLLAGVIFLIIIIILIILLFPRGPRLTPTRAFDGRIYMVLEGSAKQKSASANKLAQLRGKLVQLIDDLQHSTELTDDNKRRLKHKFKAIISENSPGGRHTSYTVNKGEHIYMCLRGKKSLNFEDDNVVMFVAIHELAHVMTRTIGHKPDFKRNFRMLLKQAEKRGYYTYYPFHIKPKRYCGTVISSLP